VKAIVLAAGYATRLYPLTLDTPKPLLEVGGRPMVDYVLDALRTADVDEVFVVTNAKFASQFRAWAPVGVTVIDDGTTSEGDRLGAIGDIGFVLERTGLDDDLIVIAGDNLFTADIAGLAALGLEKDAPVLAVHDMGEDADMSQYNTTEFDDQGRITFFEEKPRKATSTLAGTALYFYPQRTLPLVRQYLAEGNNPDQPGRLVEWLYPRTPCYVWEIPGEWYDIGSRDQLEAARAEFAAK
jgi:glucose-1-phosphate thymidylyltransferase